MRRLKMNELYNFKFLIKEFFDALHRYFSIHKVIPAEAGIQKEIKTGFRIKCGMTNCYKVFRLLIPCSLLRGSSILNFEFLGI